MAKYVIKEGVLDKFVSAILSAIGSGKTDVVKRKISDKDLQVHIDRIQKNIEELKRDIEQKRRHDPLFNKIISQYRGETK